MQNREKQIEEVRKDIFAAFGGYAKWEEDWQSLAEAVYNSGYRKQSGNVIEFPCNIGDSCYPLPRSRKPIVERKVSRITFTKRNIIIGYYENDGQYRPPLRTRTLGEDVFLTREEAKKALAKMKGGAE